MPAQRMHPLPWTEEEFYVARDAAPQGERWELVDGEVFVSPLDVKFQKGLVLQPDILVVPSGVLRSREDIVDRLLLVVETISPSSARYDRVKKRPAYPKAARPRR